MEGERNRKAHYVSAIAYRDESGVHIFRGTVDGEIAHSIRGTNGFGYDPIFIPSEGDGQHIRRDGTRGEEQDQPPRRAFRALAEWLKN